MENQTNTVKSPKAIFAQTKEHSVEADMILPDYYPEITKILDCSVSLSQETVTLTADKISISGAANLKLLYVSAENELKVYESVTKYTKLVSGGGFESGDVCIVRQNVSALNYRAVSPRKIEIRIAAAVSAEIYRISETPLLGDIADDRLEKKIMARDGFQIHAFASADLELEEKIGLPVEKEEITGVLKEQAHISWTEIRAMKNKLMLSGVAQVGFSLVTAKGEVSQQHTVTLPFTQVKDLSGVEEKDQCFVSLTQTNVRIDVKKSDAGEAVCFIQANAVIAAGTQESFRLVDDVYGIRGRAEKTASENVWIDKALFETYAVRCSGELPTYDVDVREIAEKAASDLSFAVTAAGESAELSGSLLLKILVKTGDCAYYSFARNVSFAETLPSNGNIAFSSAGMYVKSVSAERRGDGTLGFSLELAVEMLILQGENIRLISGAEFVQDEKTEDKEHIILYYGSKGESVWNIAKENRTPLASLKALNALEEDVLPENKLLVFQG